MNLKRSQFWLPILFLLVLLALWQFLAARVVVSFWVLPSPLDVLKVFIEYPNLIWNHLKPTLWESVAGLALATVIGVITALLMHGSKLFKQIFYPYLIVSQTVPIIAVAPLIILWFGYGIQPRSLWWCWSASSLSRWVCSMG